MNSQCLPLGALELWPPFRRVQSWGNQPKFLYLHISGRSLAIGVPRRRQILGMVVPCNCGWLPGKDAAMNWLSQQLKVRYICLKRGSGMKQQVIYNGSWVKGCERHERIHSFNTYLLSTDHTPMKVLGMGKTGEHG